MWRSPKVEHMDIMGSRAVEYRDPIMWGDVLKLGHPMSERHAAYALDEAAGMSSGAVSSDISPEPCAN